VSLCNQHDFCSDGAHAPRAQWLPSFNVVMYAGNQRSRDVIRQKVPCCVGVALRGVSCAHTRVVSRARTVQEFFLTHGRTTVHKFNVLLTTYEMVLRDSVGLCARVSVC
jgi:SNF2 family DNA or RNA helicase